MKLKSTFQRRETKYILTMREYDALRLGLLPYMQEDEYGLHTTLSLYCDMALVSQSLSGSLLRTKGPFKL